MIEIPWYLRWWSPVKALPETFHQMDMQAFQAFLSSLLQNTKDSGFIHHSTLLAMGLILRELQATLFNNEQREPPSLMTPAHHTLILGELQATCTKVLATAAEHAPVFPPDGMEDNIGFICYGPEDMVSPNTQPGSPLEATSGQRNGAVQYLKALSSLEVYQHAFKHSNKVSPL